MVGGATLDRVQGPGALTPSQVALTCLALLAGLVPAVSVFAAELAVGRRRRRGGKGEVEVDQCPVSQKKFNKKNTECQR